MQKAAKQGQKGVQGVPNNVPNTCQSFGFAELVQNLASAGRKHRAKTQKAPKAGRKGAPTMATWWGPQKTAEHPQKLAKSCRIHRTTRTRAVWPVRAERSECLKVLMVVDGNIATSPTPPCGLPHACPTRVSWAIARDGKIGNKGVGLSQNRPQKWISCEFLHHISGTHFFTTTPMPKSCAGCKLGRAD